MEPEAAQRRNPRRTALVLTAVVVLVMLGIVLSRPPRLVWGSWMRNPTPPKDHRTYLVHGDGILDDLRILLSKSRFVFVPVPADGSANPGWPRLTGLHRMSPGGSLEQEQIEIEAP